MCGLMTILIYVSGKRKKSSRDSESSSSKISTSDIQSIVEKLRNQRHRDSTRNNYYSIWHSFNKFILRLDNKPRNWGDRLTLFVAYLIENKRKSSTIKCYISAIRAVLENGNIKLNEDEALLKSLTRACKIHRDKVTNKLPIRLSLLRTLLRNVDKLFDTAQPYLCTMYKALISTTYYSMFRVGEVTASQHVVKAKDVFMGMNKDKMMFILHSSKTHNQGDKPQIIKIKSDRKAKSKDKMFCPFHLLNSYRKMRKHYTSDDEQFFVFRDGSPVLPSHLRKILKDLFKKLNINPNGYTITALRLGRATDLLEMGVSVETIRKLGRWKSSAVYTYLRV